MDGQTLSQLIEDVCGRNGARVAMIDPAGVPVAFENLFFTIVAFAEALEDRGVGPGDLVAVQIEDAIAGNLLRLAVVRLGATAMTLPGGVDAAAFGMAVDWRLVPPGASRGDAREIVVDAGWIRPPRRMIAAAGGGHMVRATSGTTGRPKFRLISEEAALARALRGSDWRGVPDGPLFIGYAPASSPFFNHMVRALVAGALQLHPGGTHAASLNAIVAHGATSAFVSPYNFARLLDAAEATGIRPEALKAVMVGGGEVSPAQAARGEALLGAEVVLCYGSSETGSIAHFRPALAEATPGVVGPIYADQEYRFADETGASSDPSTGGELWLRVPEAIRVTEFPSGVPVCDPDGWVATGDIGRILPDGSFQFTGRRSEFLNVGGNKRAPSEFEAVARQFPALREVAAFRAPVESGMDHVGLALVPDAGFDRAGFEAHMAARLGPRYPIEIIILDDLPATAAGKTDRRRLTETFLDRRMIAAAS